MNEDSRDVCASTGGAKEISPPRELWVGPRIHKPRRGGRRGLHNGVFRFTSWEQFNEWKEAHGPASTNVC